MCIPVDGTPGDTPTRSTMETGIAIPGIAPQITATTVVGDGEETLGATTGDSIEATIADTEMDITMALPMDTPTATTMAETMDVATTVIFGTTGIVRPERLLPSATVARRLTAVG